MPSKSSISVVVVSRPSVAVEDADDPASAGPAKYLTHFSIPVSFLWANGAGITGAAFLDRLKNICQQKNLACGNMSFQLEKPVDQDLWAENTTRSVMKQTIQSFDMNDVFPIELWDIITQPQIIIAVLSISPPCTTPSSTGASEQYESTLMTIDKAENTQYQLREEIVEAARQNGDTPSAGSKLGHRIATQGTEASPGHRHKWYNSRPASLGGPPIFIYEEVFSDFVRNMQEHEPTSQELDAAYEFVDRALNLYQQEKARLNTLKEDMCKLMGMSEIEQEFQFNVSFKPDGARTCVERTHLPPFSGLLELMNEIGEEGCDPASQAECDYAAVFLSDKAIPIRQKSHCPAFLVAMAGPHISVSGAVFTEGLISQPLTDYISIIPRLGRKGRSAIDDTVFRVAKLFFALKAGIDAIDEKYTKLMASLPRASAFADIGIAGTSMSANIREPVPTRQEFIGPHFCAFRDQAGNDIQLHYHKRYLDPFRRSVFLARATTSESGQSKLVIVKFAYRYNVSAHKLLAAEKPSLAPELLYNEERDDLGGLCVIVMEYFAASSRGYLSHCQIEKLRKAVTLLHLKGLVFGDLRSPNILSDDEDNLMLIDFDWCGEEGEATYPSDILLAGNTFHPDVQKGGRLRKEHDAFRFKSLTGEELDHSHDV